MDPFIRKRVCVCVDTNMDSSVLDFHVLSFPNKPVSDYYFLLFFKTGNYFIIALLFFFLIKKETRTVRERKRESGIYV